MTKIAISIGKEIAKGMITMSMVFAMFYMYLSWS